MARARAGAAPLITLLTDFGDRGTYVGSIKGVIHQLHPAARIVDLTHRVTPQAIREGAFLLHGAYRDFPPGTIHVAVVDPGVGTARRPLALAVPGIGYCLGPDNGLFSALLAEHPASEARAIAHPEATIARLGRAISATFHGRDIFAPAAAFLAGGGAFAALGARLDPAALVRLPRVWADWDAPGDRGRGLRGEVVHIDSFGNLITNIPRGRFADLPPGALARAQVDAGPHTPVGIGATYGEQPPGTVIALFGSAGTLEIARVNGRADRDERGAPLALGLPVTVRVGALSGARSGA